MEEEMKSKEKKETLFFEEKIIISLIFITTIIIFMKLVGSFISEEIGTKMQEYATYLIGWIVFFSLSYSIKKGALLNIDIIYAKYSENVKEKINLAVQILLAVIMLIFTYYAVQIFIDKINDSETTLLNVIVYIGPILGFTLSFIRSIQNIFKREEE